MRNKPATSADFLELLAKSGLVQADDMAVLQDKADSGPQDASGLAAELVDQKRLTGYQAEHLLAGRSGGFFLGKYKLLEPLGQGGMGIVFRAEDTALRRDVALKLLPHQASQDERLVARFQREARLAAQLKHENIVRVYDVGQERRSHFIAMELVDGQDLARLLNEKGRLSPHEAVCITRQVAAGLDYANRQGIIHRDIKPANILISPDGGVKILDLGLARFALAGSAAAASLILTQTGEVMGTLDYMAPEQAEETRQADTRSDLYALGCTLYQCLIGRPPFPAGTTAEKLRMHREEVAPAVNQLVPEVPADLAEVVSRMMAKRPEQRYQSPSELLQELQNLGIEQRPMSGQQGNDASSNVQDEDSLATRVPESSDQVDPRDAPHQTSGHPIHDTAEHGSVLGDFRIEKRIGAGGMGVVYRAQQLSLNRPVALKVIRPGIGVSSTTLSRFRREAQAAAKLHHTNIVAVYAEGESDGTYYYAMELIEGIDLARVISERSADQLLKDSTAERTRPDVSSEDTTAVTAGSTTSLSSSGSGRGYFEKLATSIAEVADALHYAHQHGVIHRDIKPSNLLLDNEGRLKLTDFGLARILEEPGVTVSGEFLGTPRYMSPEQVVAGRMEIDHRTDIYSLGVTLYELFTGQPPYSGNHRVEVVTQIMTKEPAAPRRLDKTVPIDLDTICLKCLEKDPGKRYSSARQLADELRRFVRHDPIHARRISTVGRAWKWCRRNPAVASLTALAGSLLLLLAIGGPITAVRQASARIDAEDAREATRRLLYVSDMRSATLAWEEGNVTEVRDLLDRHRPKSTQEDLRGFEWYHLWQRLEDASSVRSLSLDRPVQSIDYSNDGTTLAVASGKGIHLWDVSSNTRRRILEGHDGPVISVAFSPQDDGVLASIGGDRIVIWDAMTGRVNATLGGPRSYITGEFKNTGCVRFSPDGKWLASCGRGPITLWNTETWNEDDSAVLDDQSDVFSMAFSPDGKILAAGERGRMVKLFDVAGRREIANIQHRGGHRFAVTFSGDSRTLVSAGNDTRIEFWDVATQEQVATFHGSLGPIMAAVISPDGETLATSGQDRTIKLWDVTSKLPRTVLRGHTSRIHTVVFSPDGDTLASGSENGQVMLWDVSGNPDPDTLQGSDDWILGLAVSPDGKRLASGGHFDGTLKLWDVASRAVLNEKKFPNIWCIAYAPDGESLAVGTGPNVTIWGIDPWRELDKLEGQPTVHCLAYSPDGTMLAAGNWPGEGGDVVIWDLTDRRQIATIDGFDSWFGGLAFSPIGGMLAIPREDARITLWDVASQRIVAELKGGSATIRNVAFSPDGQTLASSSSGQIVLWDVASRRQQTVLESNQATVEWLAFTPDGRTLASSGTDGAIKLWSLALNREVAALRGRDGPLSAIAFSRDGSVLAAAGFHPTIRLWRAASRDQQSRSDVRR